MYGCRVRSLVPGASSPIEKEVAKVVLRNSLRVRSGENIIVESWSGALPWARPFVPEARRIGAHPMMLLEDEESYWESVETARPQALGTVGSHEWSALAKTAAYVFFFGPSEPARMEALRIKNPDALFRYNPDWYRRAKKARIRGARMQIGRTSQMSADRFQVDLDAWREELVRASLVPPSQLHQKGVKLRRKLATGKRVTVSHSNGTQLEFKLGRFPVQLDDALVDEEDLRAGNNMATIPGGVVGVAVDHTSAEGTVEGNRTAYYPWGPSDGIQWTFRDGHLTDHAYGMGQEAFEKTYAKAPKGKDRMSFLSIGLNPEITMSPQMEDQELGAVMLRIGGNSFVGGKNNCPFGVWVVIRGANVSIDDHPVVQDGHIV